MATIEVMRLPSAERHEAPHRFDYKGQHRYLITLPTHLGKPLFAASDRVFGILGALREEAALHMFDVYAYCFLPARLLLLVRGRDITSDMKVFLSAFRVRTNGQSQQELGQPVWSKKYIERVLRKGEESRDIAKQIFLAPVKEGLVAVATAYPYLGSFVVPVEKILLPAPSFRPVKAPRPTKPPRFRKPMGKGPGRNPHGPRTRKRR